MKCNFQNSNSQKNWWRYIYSPNSVSEYTERQRVIVSLRATCRSYWRNGEDGPANALRVLHWERERERERERDGREEFEKWKCMMMKKENLYMWVKCRASCAASNGGKSRVKSGVKDDSDPYILNPNGSFTGLSR